MHRALECIHSPMLSYICLYPLTSCIGVKELEGSGRKRKVATTDYVVMTDRLMKALGCGQLLHDFLLEFGQVGQLTGQV